LRLVRPGVIDSCPPAPGKGPHTQDASLCSMRLDHRTHRQYRVRLGLTLFFLLMVVVKFNLKAFANSANMVEWLDEQVIPVLDRFNTLHSWH